MNVLFSATVNRNAGHEENVAHARAFCAAREDTRSWPAVVLQAWGRV